MLYIWISYNEGLGSGLPAATLLSLCGTNRAMPWVSCRLLMPLWSWWLLGLASSMSACFVTPTSLTPWWWGWSPWESCLWPVCYLASCGHWGPWFHRLWHCHRRLWVWPVAGGFRCYSCIWMPWGSLARTGSCHGPVYVAECCCPGSNWMPRGPPVEIADRSEAHYLGHHLLSGILSIGTGRLWSLRLC